MKQALGWREELPDDWETSAKIIRESGRKVRCGASGQIKDKVTLWWNEEVQESSEKKSLAKKWYRQI